MYLKSGPANLKKLMYLKSGPANLKKLVYLKSGPAKSPAFKNDYGRGTTTTTTITRAMLHGGGPKRPNPARTVVALAAAS